MSRSTAEPSNKIVFTDRSVTVTNASTQVMAANPNRIYLFIQNLDVSKDLWINFGVAANADTPSIKILAGGSFVMEGSIINTDDINAISSLSSHKICAKEA